MRHISQRQGQLGQRAGKLSECVGGWVRAGATGGQSEWECESESAIVGDLGVYNKICTAVASQMTCGQCHMLMMK